MEHKFNPSCHPGRPRSPPPGGLPSLERGAAVCGGGPSPFSFLPSPFLPPPFLPSPFLPSPFLPSPFLPSFLPSLLPSFLPWKQSFISHPSPLPALELCLWS